MSALSDDDDDGGPPTTVFDNCQAADVFEYLTSPVRSVLLFDCPTCWYDLLENLVVTNVMLLHGMHSLRHSTST